MADALVKLLNQLGYQPVFLSRTNVEPPELYNFANHKLIRRGPLVDYFPATVKFTPVPGKLANIESRQTSGKHFDASVKFLQAALSVLGITSIPKLDLSFTGTSEHVFAFTNVTYRAVNPSEIDNQLQDIHTPAAIPDSYITMGGLHIAYEYAYSNTIEMRRADGSEFSTHLDGDIGSFINLGAGGKVETKDNSSISFHTADVSAAFAYKAGRLQKTPGGVWTFEPEVVMRGLSAGAEHTFIPANDVVLRVLELPQEASSAA